MTDSSLVDKDLIKRFAENARDMLYRMSLPDGKYEYVSPASVQIFGYTPEEFYSRPVLIRDAIHPDWSDYFVEQWQQLLAGEAPPSYEYQIIHKDGSARWLLQRNRLIRTATGKVVAIEGIVTDITTRKEMESALYESEWRYRIVSELTSDYAYAFTVATDGTLTNDWVTGALQTITGFTAEEVDARGGWESLIHPDDLSIPYGQLNALLAGEPATVEYRIVCKDGLVCWMQDTARPERGTEQDRVVAIYGAVKDITPRKQAEEQRLKMEAQIQQAQKLESLGKLAGGIAHDFNNLLMGILGNASLLKLDIEPDSPLRQGVQDIETTATRAADLVKQMLAYAGKSNLAIEAVNLPKLVREMKQLLEVSISKKATLELDFDDEVPAIRGDAAQVRQIVLNLLTNASEALADEIGIITIRLGVSSGQIAVEDQLFPAGTLEPGAYVTLAVSDTGEGMAADQRQQIFDPFYTTKFMGRGLGLSAVLGIVQKHHGAIKVASEPGRGSTFTVFLPTADSHQPARISAETSQVQWRGRGQLLLVDDEQVVLSVGRRILENLGFKVSTARNGAEALTRFQSDPDRYRCVILDLTMPVMNGVDCYQHLREVREDVPVILTSGYDEQDLAEQYPDLGLAGFLQKPYSIEALIARLSAILQA